MSPGRFPARWRRAASRCARFCRVIPPVMEAARGPETRSRAALRRPGAACRRAPRRQVLYVLDAPHLFDREGHLSRAGRTRLARQPRTLCRSVSGRRPHRRGGDRGLETRPVALARLAGGTDAGLSASAERRAGQDLDHGAQHRLPGSRRQRKSSRALRSTVKRVHPGRIRVLGARSARLRRG